MSSDNSIQLTSRGMNVNLSLSGDATGGIMAYRAKLEKKLKEKNQFTDLLELVEKKTGVDRLYLVLGVFCILMPKFF